QRGGATRDGCRLEEPASAELIGEDRFVVHVTKGPFLTELAHTRRADWQCPTEYGCGALLVKEEAPSHEGAPPYIDVALSRPRRPGIGVESRPSQKQAAATRRHRLWIAEAAPDSPDFRSAECVDRAACGGSPALDCQAPRVLDCRCRRASPADPRASAVP